MEDANDAKREKPKYYVATEIDFVAEGISELREILENNDVESVRVIKGFEVYPKKKIVYSL
jgi:hypothetical protein